MISTALTTWESTVAMATPNTSQWKPSTKSRSSTMFTRQQTMSTYRGMRLSPMARSTPVPTLYIMLAMMPQ